MGPESYPRRGSPQKLSWRPLGALLDALGAEKSKLGTALGRSWAALGACYSAKTPRVKPDQAVRPESTDVIICLRPWKHLPASV